MKTRLQTIDEEVRLSEWKHIIQECRNSGETVKRWCEKNNISEPSYYYYLKKIRQSLISEEDKPSFVPVMLEHKPENEEIIEIKKGSVQIQVLNTVDEKTLVSLIKALLC